MRDLCAKLSLETMTLTRLQAVVLLRQAIRDLLPHLPGQAQRDAAGKALQDTSHLIVELRPSVVTPHLFGWAVRAIGAEPALWSLVTVPAEVERLMSTRNDAGEPQYEVIPLAAVPSLRSRPEPFPAAAGSIT